MASMLALIFAVGTRLVFGVHSVVVVWRTTDALQSRIYWLLASGLVLLLIEMIITLVKRQGREWTWFCPSFFFYLLSTLPGIWLLEFDRLHRYRSDTNGTVHDDLVTLSDFGGFRIPLVMAPDTWVFVLEQSLLFLLIIGRWLLPKGDITHDQLSQLLLVYIGIASDIMEILDLFEEPEVLNEPQLDYFILGAFSSSLFQYTLVLTATKARKRRVVHSLKKTEEEDEEERIEMAELGKSDPPNTNASNNLTKTANGETVSGNNTRNTPTAWDIKVKRAKKQKAQEKRDRCSCCRTEIWSIMMTVMMQDGPFLAIRLYVMVELKVMNYTIIFFTFKNILVLLLQFYRILVVASHSGRRARERLSARRTRNAMIKEHSNASTATWASNRTKPSEGIYKQKPW